MIFLFVIFCLSLFYAVGETIFERDWPRVTGKYVLLLVVLILCATISRAQGLRFEAHVTTAAKNVPLGAQAPVLTLPNASITVCAEPANPVGAVCTNVVPVYSDQALTQPIPQPITADSQGRFLFWAAAGQYDYSVQTAQGTYVGTYAANIPYTGSPATSSVPGIVQLAPGQTSDVLSTVATTGRYGDLTGTPIVNLDNYGGTDTCTQLAAAEAAYVGKPVTFGVTDVGTTCTVPVTLGAQHALYVTTPINFSAHGYITPTSFNEIRCVGAGALVNAGMYTYGSNVNNPFVYVPAGSASASHLHITGCRVDGWPNSQGFAQLFNTNIYATDITIDHNDLHNAQLFMQQGAPVSTPSLRWSVASNRVNWDAGETPGLYCGNVYGALQFSSFDGNTCMGTSGGFELFASTSSGAIGSSNPDFNGILSGGLGDDSITNNTFVNIGGSASAVFTSTAYRMLIQGNVSNGSDDVTYDLEANSDSAVLNNQATEFHTAGMGTFFTSIRNRFAGNTLTTAEGSFGLIVKNAGGYPYINTDTVVEGNHYRSTTTAGIGGFALLEATQRIIFKDNDSYNGPIAYGTSFNPATVFQNNTFTYTVALPLSNGGYGNGRFAGIDLGDYSDSTYERASGNTLITTIPQASGSPCLAAGLSQSNPPAPTATLKNNACIGPWATDISLSSGSTNQGVVPTFILDSNELSAGVVTANTGGVVPHIVCRNNYAGANAVNCSQ